MTANRRGSSFPVTLLSKDLWCFYKTLASVSCLCIHNAYETQWNQISSSTILFSEHRSWIPQTYKQQLGSLLELCVIFATALYCGALYFIILTEIVEFDRIKRHLLLYVLIIMIIIYLILLFYVFFLQYAGTGNCSCIIEYTATNSIYKIYLQNLSRVETK